MTALRVCQVGLDVVLQSGGTTRAAADIHAAIGGSIVSFTDPSLAPRFPVPDVISVPHGARGWARRYGYAPSSQTGAAEQAVTGADVVIVHSLYRYHFDWASRLCKVHRRPLVVVPHGSLDPYVFTYRGLQKRAWLALRGRSAIHRADLVLFVSHREHEKALQRISPRRFAIMPLPVECLSVPGAEAREAARRDRGFAPSDRVFLYFGRLHPAKRPFETLHAFAAASCRAPNARLLVVGPDTEDVSRADCEQLAKTLALANVRFEPAAYGSDKAAVLACADVLVNFSWKENFGYGVCEALAAGVPAIVSEGNDLGPELQTAGCAWQLRRDDVDALAEGIVAASEASSETLHTMGERGREWVHRELAPERFRARLSELLTGIVRR